MHTTQSSYCPGTLRMTSAGLSLPSC
jgi:hypothetical protein